MNTQDKSFIWKETTTKCEGNVIKKCSVFWQKILRWKFLAEKLRISCIYFFILGLISPSKTSSKADSQFILSFSALSKFFCNYTKSIILTSPFLVLKLSCNPILSNSNLSNPKLSMTTLSNHPYYRTPKRPKTYIIESLKDRKHQKIEYSQLG